MRCRWGTDGGSWKLLGWTWGDIRRNMRRGWRWAEDTITGWRRREGAYQR